MQINSDRPEGTVTAQAPKAGTTLVEGATVRINVSQGPRPVAVPSVIGLAYESAASVLQGSGFGVGREDVDSDQPEGIVVGQAPAAGQSVAKGTTITLQVSKGPQTTGVPDVTSLDEGLARRTLEGAGFTVVSEPQDTDDPTLAERVISQDPPAGTELEQGGTVTIFVGVFTGGDTTQAPDATPPPPPASP